jgi:hypothetical protein
MRLDHQLNGRIIITLTNSYQLLIGVLRIWVSNHVEQRNVNLKAPDKAIDNNCTGKTFRIHFDMSTYPKQQEKALKQ